MKYLDKDNNNYALGVRAIHEFEGYLRQNMPDAIEECCLCKQIVFRVCIIPVFASIIFHNPIMYLRTSRFRGSFQKYVSKYYISSLLPIVELLLSLVLCKLSTNVYYSFVNLNSQETVNSDGRV